MQTFLPYADFRESADVLDNKRLNNQINETTVILRTLLGTYREGGGWPHHPVTKMWRGYENALALYQRSCCNEYLRRNHQQHTGRFTLEGLIAKLDVNIVDPVMPPWLGDERVHSSHRSNLLRKDPDHYGLFGWDEGPDIPYHYPTQEEAA